jgi:hypothetical protein
MLFSKVSSFVLNKIGRSYSLDNRRLLSSLKLLELGEIIRN